MKLTIVPVQGEEAITLKDFIRPEVWEMPECKSFWYLAAKNEQNDVVGAIAVDPVEPEARLLSIAVSPSCTRMGVATELLDRAIRLLDKAGIHWLGATHTLPPQGWGALGTLLERNGFVLDGGERYAYEITLGEITAHPLLELQQPPAGPACLADLSHLEYRSLVGLLSKNKIAPTVLQQCDPTCSFVYRRGQNMEAMFLLSTPGEGMIVNLWTWLSAASAHSRAPIELFFAAFQKAAQTCPPDTRVLFTCINEASDRLLHHFFPNIQPVQALRTYYTSTDGGDIPQEEEEQPRQAAPAGTAPDRQAYWSDLHLELADDSDLYCARCRFRSAADMTSCEKYLVKPGEVLYGAPCAQFVQI